MVNYVVKKPLPENPGSGSFVQRIWSKQYCQFQKAVFVCTIVPSNPNIVKSFLP